MWDGHVGAVEPSGTSPGPLRRRSGLAAAQRLLTAARRRATARRRGALAVTAGVVLAAGLGLARARHHAVPGYPLEQKVVTAYAGQDVPASGVVCPRPVHPFPGRRYRCTGILDGGRRVLVVVFLDRRHFEVLAQDPS